MRKGIEQLIDEGVLIRKQGSGTFVARRIETRGGKLSSFSDDTRSRGEAPGVVWINKTYAQPTEEEASALEVAATSQVARLGRVRLAGGEPLAIEHAVIPAEFLPTSIGSVTRSIRRSTATAFAPPAANSACGLRWPRRPRRAFSA